MVVLFEFFCSFAFDTLVSGHTHEKRHGCVEELLLLPQRSLLKVGIAFNSIRFVASNITFAAPAIAARREIAVVKNIESRTNCQPLRWSNRDERRKIWSLNTKREAEI